MDYYIYVIELDDAAGPRVDPLKPVVYVGQSAHPPEIRFEQHRNGVHASRWVRRYGVRLRPRLFARYNPLPTRPAAEQLEARLAARLRQKGYRVRGGH
jgi:hypothetical protein